MLGDPAFVGIDGNLGLDPGLAAIATGDAHLTSTSPVVDSPAPPPTWPPVAMWVTAPWPHEDSYSDVADLDGDPRQVGAAFDPGADELRIPTLYAWDRPELGSTFFVRAQADPFDPLFVYYSAGLLGTPLFGFVWLAPPQLLLATPVADAAGFASLTAVVPENPGLVGVDLYLQAARPAGGFFDGTAPVWIRLQP